MKFSKTLIATLVAATCANTAWAAVSAEEARQLGNNLTLFGAEKAGNKDGSIPEYTGGLPVDTNPPGFKKDSGRWVNPYAGEKPLFSITAQNMDKYADKLTEASKVLLKRYPSYRMDIYPSHRTINYPKHILDATLRNATTVVAADNGLKLENMLSGIPFPIVKTGYEAMWNHMTRWSGVAQSAHTLNYYVDANGQMVKAAETDASFNWPGNAPGMTQEEFKKRGSWFFQAAYNYTSPPRIQGDCNLIQDSFDPMSQPRKAFSYSASTRRVRLAPDIAYDTPMASSGGVSTYDEAMLYMGKLDRFEFKLIGKRELYIPYNSYDAVFTDSETKVLTPKHINPDLMRWEPHRVWVVEATLKPGLRHIYSKRILYLDEDWSGGGASDEYDAGNKLYKGFFLLPLQAYDKQTAISTSTIGYDLATGTYSYLGFFGDAKGYVKVLDKLLPANLFTPDGLVSRSKQ